MKRLGLLLILCFVAGSLLAARPFKVVNIKSASATHNQVTDSTDTAECDTVYSETLTVGTTRFNVIPKFGVTRATGANDSMLCIVQLYSRYKGLNYNVVLKTDTLGGNNVAADTNMWYFGSDSLLFDQMWFRCIILDSVIASTNSAAGGKKLDTNYVTITYTILPR